MHGKRRLAFAPPVEAIGEDDEACLPLRIDQAMDGGRVGGGVPVRGHLQRCAPSEARIVAAGQRTDGERMIHRPGGEHRFTIRQQHGIAVPVVNLRRAACDDNLAFRVAGQVHGGNRDRTQSAGRGTDVGGHRRAERERRHGGKQGNHQAEQTENSSHRNLIGQPTGTDDNGEAGVMITACRNHLHPFRILPGPPESRR